MQGKIIKGIGGFYYIHAEHQGIYECKAKGVFRNRKIKPLVGDNVEIDVIDEAEKKGNIRDILPRKNELIRPAVANIDQALVFFAAAQPEPNLGLLDRFLLQMEYRNIPTVIGFNKCDLTETDRIRELEEAYGRSGYPLIFVSVREEQGLENLKAMLAGKTTALAGPSGAGKSSLMNWLLPEAEMETGAVSEKIKRGRHTTRHSELFHLGEGTYLLIRRDSVRCIWRILQMKHLNYISENFPILKMNVVSRAAITSTNRTAALKKRWRTGR